MYIQVKVFLNRTREIKQLPIGHTVREQVSKIGLTWNHPAI